MTIKTWLDTATRDAGQRNLPALVPLLDTLSRSTSALRAADWNADASDTPRPPSIPHER